MTPKAFASVPLLFVGFIFGFGIVGAESIQVIGKLTGAMLIIVLIDVLKESFSNRFKRIPIYIPKVLQIVLISYLVFSSFGMLQQAKLGPIDDHEIAMFVGDDNRIAMSEIPTLLMATEVGKFGTALRYRPSYYTLRIFESLLWGQQAELWYLVRIVGLCIGLFFLWEFLNHFFPFSVSGLVVLTVFAQTYIIDIFTRLGPAETYGYIAFPILLWATTKLIISLRKSQTAHVMHVALLVLSFVIVVGVKENFIPLVGVLATLAVISFRAKKYILSSFLTLICLYPLIIATEIFLAISTAKHDIYHSNVDIIQRLSLVSNIFSVPIFRYMLTFSVGFSAVYILAMKRVHFPKSLLQTVSPLLLLLILSLLTYVSQYLFYSGAWPTGVRYDYPGLMVIPIAIASMLLILVRTLEAYKLPDSLVLGFKISLLVLASLSVSSQVILAKGYYQLASANTVVITSVHDQWISSIVAAINSRHPTADLVIEAEQPNDYEFIFSLQRFLVANGISNQIALNVSDSMKNASGSSTLSTSLSSQLVEVSTIGSTEFAPLSEADPATCVSIWLHGKRASGIYCQQSL